MILIFKSRSVALLPFQKIWVDESILPLSSNKDSFVQTNSKAISLAEYPVLNLALFIFLATDEDANAGGLYVDFDD